MALPVWLGAIFEPVANLVDELHTSKEEKEQLKVAILGQQTELAIKVMEYEVKQAEHQKDIIVAEAQGQSWLQRNWRPLIMTTFGAIVAWNYIIGPLGSWVSSWFGGPAFPALEMTQGFWTLLSIGIGGYIAGRSGEKIARTVTQK
jgi:hypothetical protein